MTSAISRALIGVGLALACLVAPPNPAAAQGRIGIGLAAPRGTAADYRDPGPVVSLSSESHLTGVLRLRLELEGAYFGGRPYLHGTRRDLWMAGVGVSLVLRARGELAPYALAGLGYSWLALRGNDSPYTSSARAASAQAGVGLEQDYGSWALFGELRWGVYLSGIAADDFDWLRTTGLRAGVRLPLP